MGCSSINGIHYAINKEDVSQAISNGYDLAEDIPATRDTPYADEFLETIKNMTKLTDENEVRDTYTYLFKF